MVWWWLEKADKRKVFFVSLLVVVLPLVPGLFSASGLARAKQTSLFTDPGIAAAIDENRSFCYLVDRRLSPVCKVIFNKVTQSASRLAGNYLSFFSPEFLFLSGDKNLYLNHPDFGEFHFLLLPMLLLGLTGLVMTDRKDRQLLIGLLLLAPLPAALAGTAQMVRASAMLLPLLLIMGVGVEKLWKGLLGPKRTGWRVAVLLVGGLITVQWLVSYFLVYPTKFDNAAYQLPTEVASDLRFNADNFDTIYINDKFSDAHIWLAFYQKIDPVWYQAEVVRPEPDKFGFSHPTSLGKYDFGAETFEALYCRQKRQNFRYLSPEAVTVTLPHGVKTGYQTREYRNFSGVHVQARLIDSNVFDKYLETNALAKDRFCGN
jgi:hypothetical protein